ISRDPQDPNTLLFRLEIGFDLAGNPLGGLVPGHVYELFLPGLAQDRGPYITSRGGGPHLRRLTCRLTALSGTAAAEPGPPPSEGGGLYTSRDCPRSADRRADRRRKSTGPGRGGRLAQQSDRDLLRRLDEPRFARESDNRSVEHDPRLVRSQPEQRGRPGSDP